MSDQTNQSNFAQAMSSEAGIVSMMNDMGAALASGNVVAMFGGGNPAHIPAVSDTFKATLQAMLHDDQELSAMMGNYDAPRGNAKFISAVKDFLNRHYGLGLSEENIVVTPGSQSGMFMLFNLLAGRHGPRQKKILFPLVPEYVGYADQALEPSAFVSAKPLIEKIGEHEFKYKINFDELEKIEHVTAICLSRPTNPSGNVVSTDELKRLDEIAAARNVPLIIDSAYGLPFPGMMATKTGLFYSERTILSLSLSKIGLPGVRTGIFIGPKEIMNRMAYANAIINLTSAGFGQYLLRPLLDNDEILRLSAEHIQPHYYERAAKAHELIEQHFPKDLPWRLHTHEGSYFFWLWCEGMTLTSRNIYEELKQRGVIVVPGNSFFPGLGGEDWRHASECLRLNIARPDAELEHGIGIVAEVLSAAWQGSVK